MHVPTMVNHKTRDGDGSTRPSGTLRPPCGSLKRPINLGLGKLDRRTGKHKQAPEHLSTATTMYREVDMQFWLEHADVETKERAR